MNWFKRKTTYQLRSSKLDWEESALNSLSPVEGFEHNYGSVRHFSVQWLYGVIVLIAGIFLIQLFRIQIISGPAYAESAEDNRLRVQTILAPRGEIFDRNGSVLVRNTASFRIVAQPGDVPKQTADEQLKNLATMLGKPEDELLKLKDKILVKSHQDVVLANNISREQSILFETKNIDFPGFRVETIPVRQYPFALPFAHVLGYSAYLSEKEAENVDQTKYAATDFIGKLGVEASYESYLHGENGAKKIEVNAQGQPVKIAEVVNPKNGNALYLHINQELQQAAYDSFVKYAGKNLKGSVVILNPKNGEVLSLLSLPGYDTNKFVQGISETEYNAILNDPLKPLINRSIAGKYPPGSTIKPITALAALEKGVVNPNTVIVDGGVLRITNQFNPNIVYSYHGWKRSGLGPMTIRSAIAMSSDIYFYTVAGGHPKSKITGMGADALADYYKKAQTDSKSGIDIPGELTGVVASPAWKANYFASNPIDSKWYLGDTYHISIGQGNMLATPLGVTQWTALVANNGKLFAPRVVNRVENEAGETIFKPEQKTIIENIASSEHLKVVQEGMRQTVTAGTARRLNTLPFAVAGKTGTSQYDGGDLSKTHAWFTAYVPYENPQFAITVLVESGGGGDEIAVPITKEILEWCNQSKQCFDF